VSQHDVRLIVLVCISVVAFRYAAAAASAADTDQNVLRGVWRGWVVEGRGENPDRGHVHLELTVSADRMKAKDLGGKRGDPNLGEGTFRFTSTKEPRYIDAVRTSMPGRGKKWLGIITCDGDTLKWCVAPPNKPRPTEFESKRGQYLLILKRQSPRNSSSRNDR